MSEFKHFKPITEPRTCSIIPPLEAGQDRREFARTVERTHFDMTGQAIKAEVSADGKQVTETPVELS